MRENITAVIRSAGERTTELCRYLISQQIPENHIFIVVEHPSTEGTRAVYECGLREGRKWTLFVDADQLLLPDAIEFLYNLAEDQFVPAFGVKGTVIDKLFLDQRGMGCGPILYHTEAFERAIHFIPDPNTTLRPDSYIISQMKQHHSYEWVREQKNTAYHDYEQYYRDIYKKMIVNARKMGAKCNKMINQWNTLSLIDRDYLICLQGFDAGKKYKDSLIIDYTFDYNYVEDFPEKPPITEKDFEGVIEKLCLK